MLLYAVFAFHADPCHCLFSPGGPWTRRMFPAQSLPFMLLPATACCTAACWLGFKSVHTSLSSLSLLLLLSLSLSQICADKRHLNCAGSAARTLSRRGDGCKQSMASAKADQMRPPVAPLPITAIDQGLRSACSDCSSWCIQLPSGAKAAGSGKNQRMRYVS
jgi:hypothetical protein